jgi:hypothetical protein
MHLTGAREDPSTEISKNSKLNKTLKCQQENQMCRLSLATSFEKKKGPGFCSKLIDSAEGQSICYSTNR